MEYKITENNQNLPKFRGYDVKHKKEYSWQELLEKFDVKLLLTSPQIFNIRLDSYSHLSDRLGNELYVNDVVSDMFEDEYGKIIFDEGMYQVVFGNVTTDLFELNDEITKQGTVYTEADLLS